MVLEKSSRKNFEYVVTRIKISVEILIIVNDIDWVFSVEILDYMSVPIEIKLNKFYPW